MTVKELINFLDTCKQDKKILIKYTDIDSGYDEEIVVDEVYEEHDYVILI